MMKIILIPSFTCKTSATAHRCVKGLDALIPSNAGWIATCCGTTRRARCASGRRPSRKADLARSGQSAQHNQPGSRQTTKCKFRNGRKNAELFRTTRCATDPYVSPPRSLTMSWLLYGSTGWIGGMLHDMLKQQGQTVHLVRACRTRRNAPHVCRARLVSRTGSTSRRSLTSTSPSTSSTALVWYVASANRMDLLSPSAPDWPP